MVKGLEYLLGIAFLVLFAGFWHYATGGSSVAEPVAMRVRPVVPLADLFAVPEGVMLHPGHAWVRAETPRLAVIGMDDFAQQLVGPLVALDLPAVGTTLEQGSRGWGLRADSKGVDMLAPIAGRVVAVNQDLLARPSLVNDDPYGRGWLMKVESPRLAANANQLLKGRAAQDLMSRSWDELSGLFSPGLGMVMQDGGVPVVGFARSLDEENWDAIARRFLLT